MSVADSIPTMPPARVACEGKRSSDVLRWGIVALLVGVIFIPHLFAPSLARVEGSMIRAGIMLAEIGLVLGWSLRRREVLVPRRTSFGVWVVGGAWVAAVLIATGAAVHGAPAVLRTAEWVAHGLFAAVLWSEFQRDRATLDAAVRALPVGFVVFVAAVGLFAVRHPDPFHHDWLKDVPYLGHVRRFGMYALVGAAFSARAFLDPDASERSRRLAWVSLMLSWAVLFWSGGRGAIGAGLVVSGCLWGLAGGCRVRFAKAFGSALVVGGALSLCFPVESGGLGVWRFLLSAGGGEGEFDNGRTELWRTSLAAWQARPWLGLGPDATPFLLAPIGHVQPHNVIVQVLVEWGIVGAAAFLVLGGGGLLAAVRWTLCERDRGLAAIRAVAIAYLFGMTALAFLDGAFYHARPLLLIAAAAAMALRPGEGGAPRQIALSPTGRFGVGTLALGLVLLVVAHVGVVRAVWEPTVPEPHSARVAVVRAFPSTGSLRETAVWAQAWAEHDPEAALDWARWGQRHAFLPWYYLRFEADLLIEQGRVSEAEALYAEASRMEGAAMRLGPGWQ